MSCEITYGIAQAADMRRFRVGQPVTTPLYLAEIGPGRPHGWQGPVVIGRVVSVEDDYDSAPDADVAFWQNLIIETADGKQLRRTNYNTVPLT